MVTAGTATVAGTENTMAVIMVTTLAAVTTVSSVPRHYACECGQRYNHAFQPQQSKMAALAVAAPPSILGDPAWFTQGPEITPPPIWIALLSEKYPGRDRIHINYGSAY
ncbi:hypothetical protein ZWY2020_059614 [Hordeum vulgare]|nr:hypothetical protein ZWY2020_059614 [Hordeum vulgare]